MVSARRAARAGLGREPSTDDPPEWLWSFQMGSYFVPRIAAGEAATIEGFIQARNEWKARRDAWLLQHGYVMWGMGGISWQEFERISREEPHRVLRRPVRPIDPDNDPRDVLYRE